MMVVLADPQYWIRGAGWCPPTSATRETLLVEGVTKRQDRPAEIYYYEWSVNRWRTSETRAVLGLAGRGLYRELLDLCYTQGSIPKDPQVMAAVAGCAPVEIEQIWPLIGRHFYADKHDSSRLKNKVADVYRKNYFTYISSQKLSGQIGGLHRARRMNEIPSEPRRVAKAKTKQDNTIQDKVPRQDSTHTGLSSSVLGDDAGKAAKRKEWEDAADLIGKFPGTESLPGKPDNSIVLQCFEIAHYDLEELAAGLRKLFLTGKRPEISWAWFPKVLPQFMEKKQ